jgi:hypothetical protein
MEPLDASVSGKTVKLRVRLTGDFAGSPVELSTPIRKYGDVLYELIR